ncbi:zinc-binding dehydrogenase [Halomarina halobia]|uniref:zinc-dependent alcohol dehydrogenase n=1 Tax=Halomarina halobia TaxID=3033386 RepID=UPI0023E8D5F3|nr:zinc-binding dehydrogenase [Halomarina sp. PSR21]
MVLSEPGRLEQVAFPVPDVADEGAILEVEAASVCGTDLSLYKGTSNMGVLPVVLGHEVAGTIVDGAAETLDRWGVGVGDRVSPEPYLPCNDCGDCLQGHYHMCSEGRLYGITLPTHVKPSLWGGYGEYMYLHPKSRVHAVSDDISPKAACLSSVIGNGVRWISRKGKVSPGDSVAIVGPGAQGLASTIVAKEAGADPLVVMGLSADEKNLEVGEAVGATHTLYTDEDDVAERAIDIAGGSGFDVVVVTAPAEAAVHLAIDVVRPRGRLVQVGLLGSDASIPLDNIVGDEITLLGGVDRRATSKRR